LHGAAERGSHVPDVARQGLPKLLSSEGDRSLAELEIGREIAARFVVIAPQCAHYEVWDQDELVRLIDDIIPQYNIDPSRVYLTGMSMGGFGAWLVGLRQPKRFAALVPVCGGGRIADIQIAAAQHPEILRGLGIWAFHGAKDRVVPHEESARMIEALRAAQVPGVKFTTYPEGEHDAWSATYANPELYEWLLLHRR
jgi:predicted peptidase